MQASDIPTDLLLSQEKMPTGVPPKKQGRDRKDQQLKNKLLGYGQLRARKIQKAHLLINKKDGDCMMALKF